MALNLPKWLTRDKKGAFVVDTHQAYPVFLKALALEPDQYGLETAHQCIKMKVQEIVAGSGHDPRDEGKALVILMEAGRDKEKWAQRNAPAGRGAKAATHGREARIHFDRIRGQV